MFPTAGVVVAMGKLSNPFNDIVLTVPPGR